MDGPSGFDENEERARLEGIVTEYAAQETSTTEREMERYAAARSVEHVRGPEVLMLGAATGAWVEPVLDRVGRFTVVDAVAEAVDGVASQCPESIHGQVACFETYEPPKRYDTVILGHVLEHVVDPVFVLRRVRAWLVPGGRAVITVPNAESLHRLVGVEMGYLEAPTAFSPADMALGHRRVYTRDGLAAQVRSAGLSVTTMTGLGLKPLSNAQMDAWSPELRRAWLALGDRLPEQACVLLCVAQTPVQDRDDR